MKTLHRRLLDWTHLRAALACGCLLVAAGSTGFAQDAASNDAEAPTERRADARGERGANPPRGEPNRRGLRDRPMLDATRFDPAEAERRFAKVMDVLRDIDPALAERVANAPIERPGLRMAMLERRFPEVLRLARLREQDPPMYGLRVRELVLTRRVHELVRQHRFALRQLESNQETDADPDDLRDQLEDLAEQHVELELEIMELEVQRTAERLERMEDRLKQARRHDRETAEARLEDWLAGRLERPRGERPSRGPQDTPKPHAEER